MKNSSRSASLSFSILAPTVKVDDLRPDGNDLVPVVVDRAGKLVADVDAETAAGMQHPLAFVPDKVQVVDVALVTLVKADLVLRPLVLELPVRW